MIADNQQLFKELLCYILFIIYQRQTINEDYRYRSFPV